MNKEEEGLNKALGINLRPPMYTYAHMPVHTICPNTGKHMHARHICLSCVVWGMIHDSHAFGFE